jgi:antitoxin VapB
MNTTTQQNNSKRVKRPTDANKDEFAIIWQSYYDLHDAYDTDKAKEFIREKLKAKFKFGQQVAPQEVMTAKIFMNGRSQAVRLPKDFRFDVDEVYIERRGDEVVLRPATTQAVRAKWWQQLQSLSTQSTGDFPLVERERGNLSEPVSFDD